MSRLKIATILTAVSMLLWGCTLLDSSAPPDHTRDALAARIEETRRAQAVALDLWDRLIVGENVSCQEAIPVPDPVSLSDQALRLHPEAAEIQAQVNQAIQAVRNTADLWNIECGEMRPYVPLDTAAAGRLNALAAGDPLDQAAALLAGWPQSSGD